MDKKRQTKTFFQGILSHKISDVSEKVLENRGIMNGLWVWHAKCLTCIEANTKGRHNGKPLYSFNTAVTWLQEGTDEHQASYNGQNSEPSKNQFYGMHCINVAGYFLCLSGCCFCGCSENVDDFQGLLCGRTSSLYNRQSQEREGPDIRKTVDRSRVCSTGNRTRYCKSRNFLNR